MDENGIGTDATMHDHIQRIKDRGYVKNVAGRLKPLGLGISLLETYEDLQLKHLYKPSLRAEMEAKLKLIADGEKEPGEILKDYLAEMEQEFDNLEKARD